MPRRYLCRKCGGEFLLQRVHQRVRTPGQRYSARGGERLFCPYCGQQALEEQVGVETAKP